MSESWLVVISDLPKDMKARKWPEWKRSALVLERTGEIFVPAACSPDGEQMTVLSAMFDGAPSTLHKRHTFLALAWMEKEFPSWSDVWQAIRAKVKKAQEQARSLPVDKRGE